MTIALLVPTLEIGGVERVFTNLAHGLQEQGVEVDLVVGRAGGDMGRHLESGIAVFDLGSDRMLLSVPKLARYLRARDPEALIAAMTHSSAVAILARAIARKNVKIVATEHSTMSKIVANTRGLKYRLMPTWSRWALNLADHIVAVSGGVADDLAARTAIPRSKFQVIYNPVISDSLYDAAEAPVEHPWFQTGEPPVVVDMDSTEIPVYGQQEQSSSNGHFESNCYHPLLLFNAEGDCVAAKLRPGNVHSAEDWEELLLPEIERQLRLGDDVVFRADAAFARAISALVYRQRAEHAFRRA